MLLEKIGEPESALKKRDDLSSGRPPFVAIGDRSPVPSYYPHGQSDWEEPDEYRDYKASDSAIENKATNPLRSLYHPNTKTDEKIDSDAIHRLARRFSLFSSVDSPDRKLPPIGRVSF